MTRIREAVCIVTGAASGIGRELVIQAARRGARRVLATDVNDPGLEETCRLAEGAAGTVEKYRCDAGRADEIETFAQRVLPTLGGSRLVLINNAGIALLSGRFQDTSLEDFQRLLDINLMGVIRTTKAFYGYLMEQGEGHIVNLSSVFGLGGMDCQSAYCTSKFAVRGFTETLRMELLNSNIQVTCVHPGGIKTNIVRNSSPTGTKITNDDYELMIRQFDEIALTTAESAARQILDAVERNKTRLVIGLDGKQFDWVTRIFPVRYTRLIQRKYRQRFSNPYQKTS